MKAASTKGTIFQSELIVRESLKPTLGDRDVLVEVYASSVNPKDWKINQTISSLLPKFSPFPQFNLIGDDLSGTVIEVGKSVSTFKVGDEVYGMDMSLRTAACAEFAIISEKRIAHKPKSLSFVEAAATPLAAQTALQGFKKAKLQTGDKVLIIGASGGVGCFAVQIAKALGGKVTGVCSTKNLAFVKQLGADSVLDYSKHDVTKPQPNIDYGGFDIVFDVTSYESLASCSKLLKPEGVFLSTGGNAKAIVSSYLPYWIFSNKKSVPVWVQSHKKYLKELSDLFDSGQIKVVIDSEYDLASINSAYNRSRTGRSRGKIAIRIKNQVDLNNT